MGSQVLALSDPENIKLWHNYLLNGGPDAKRRNQRSFRLEKIIRRN